MPKDNKSFNETFQKEGVFNKVIQLGQMNEEREEQSYMISPKDKG